MNNHNSVSRYLISVVLFLTACGPNIYFSEPQPNKSTTLACFPDDIQGKYIDIDNVKDSIFIFNNSMIATSEKSVHTSLSRFDSTCEYTLEDGKIQFRRNRINYVVPYEITQDSISFSYTQYEKIEMGDSLVIKQIDKKRLSLNMLEEHGWSPVIMLVSKKKVAFAYIDNDQIEVLKEICPKVISIYKDSNQTEADYYTATPSREEFIQFIDSKDVLLPVGVFRKIR